MKKYCLLLCFLALANIAAAGEKFIIGVYSAEPQNDRTFAMLKEIGVNYVHSYSSFRAEPKSKILDLAAKHDLKVMYDLGGKWLTKEDGWQDKLNAAIDELKDHPALGMWYVWDEPDTKQLPLVKEMVAMIRAKSSIPTSLVIHERANYWDSRGYTDIWMADNYPVRGQPFPNAPLQQNFSRMMRNAATSYRKAGTPFISVLQSCNFSCFKSQAPEQYRETLRFPNLTEMRFMSFSSLCYGVNGIIFFSLHHCHLDKPEGREFFDAAFKPVIGDIGGFTDLIEAPWNVTARDSALERKENVNLAFWSRPAGSYIVLANDSPETRAINLDLSTLKDFPKTGKLAPWGFTRAGNYSLEKSILTIPEAQPWEVFIWKLEK